MFYSRLFHVSCFICSLLELLCYVITFFLSLETNIKDVNFALFNIFDKYALLIITHCL